MADARDPSTNPASSSIQVLASGVFVDEHPDAEPFRPPMSVEDRGELARWRAGEIVFVQLTPFVEFDDGHRPQRWEGTPQGPYPLPTVGSATTPLLHLIDDHARDDLGNLLGDFGIAEIKVSRFAFEA